MNTNTMLAARAEKGSAELHLQEISIPEPGPMDVLVKVASAGLAPGMMRLLAMGAFKHLPTTLGHEVAGTVAAVGADVTGMVTGTRVRVHANLNCRSCTYCRSDRDMMCPQQAMLGHAAFGEVPMPLYERYHDGGLAEYIRVPHWLVDPLPDSVSFDVGAKVHDLANAVRALKLAQLPLGGTLVVTAATGTMGTASVKLARHFGVGRLILVGRSAERLSAVRRLAGDVACDMVAIEDLPADWGTGQGLTRALRKLVPQGADAVLDFIPEGPATSQSLAALATGGTLVHMGANQAPLTLPMIAIMANCWRVVGTRACTRTDAKDVLALLDSGALDAQDLITHRYPLADVGEAVAAMQSRAEPIWMAVINP
ncbi:alcohol dehydrogenase catalytic domain-containing protein [Streptomyces sp. NBC_00878]|uniref:alcohol dehydrogenase catalytic domain-containing protein n=1 Tax=Streptomyces sp. NBC_00878 TaxID=2975854 RepID=UPI00225A8E3C|nr:alcohol dehydrogenase catalytic domain-containing protein [Streptomyces sp. NBC_00878]MCX4904653.1 alcohol dehydrogenase catalytic domain-containing protein [Streptomyces sp. NBC_00878]